MHKKTIILITVFAFLFSLVIPPQAKAQPLLGLPEPGSMVSLSPAYEPAMIKGLTVHKDNPFLFDFIVDAGEEGLKGDALKEEGQKLIKYFLASLAIPGKDLWVNLSPYEKDRIIPSALGQTAMGRDLLAQDYILKQITASLIYPEKDLGKKFWDRVYAAAQRKYGTVQIPVNTFNKVWIMADKAEVFERNQTALVVNCHLKVMLEEDYLALHKYNTAMGPRVNQSSSIASRIIRELVLPQLEQEVNSGRNFAHLRQIFNCVILSSWYKNRLKSALLNRFYANQEKIKGIALKDPNINEKIYTRYLEAYKRGVFNFIKDAGQAPVARKYFSGGVDPAMAEKPQVTHDKAAVSSIASGIARLYRMVVNFRGQRLPAPTQDHQVATNVSVPTAPSEAVRQQPQRFRFIETQEDIKLKDSDGHVLSAFSRDGKRVVTADHQGIDLWDLSKRPEVTVEYLVKKLNIAQPMARQLFANLFNSHIIDFRGQFLNNFWENGADFTEKLESLSRFTDPQRINAVLKELYFSVKRLVLESPGRQSGVPSALAISDDNEWIAVGYLSGIVDIYQEMDGKLIRRYGFVAGDAVNFIKIIGVGRVLIGTDHSIFEYNFINNHHVGPSFNSQEFISGIQSSDDGRFVVYVTQSKTLFLWTRNTGEPLPISTIADTYGNPIAVSPDKRFVAVFSNRRQHILIWSLPQTQPLILKLEPEDEKHLLERLFFSPDSKRLYLVGDRGAYFKAWDLEQEKPLSIEGAPRYMEDDINVTYHTVGHKIYLVSAGKAHGLVLRPFLEPAQASAAMSSTDAAKSRLTRIKAGISNALGQASAKVRRLLGTDLEWTLVKMSLLQSMADSLRSQPLNHEELILVLPASEIRSLSLQVFNDPAYESAIRHWVVSQLEIFLPDTTSLVRSVIDGSGVYLALKPNSTYVEGEISQLRDHFISFKNELEKKDLPSLIYQRWGITLGARGLPSVIILTASHGVFSLESMQVKRVLDVLMKPGSSYKIPMAHLSRMQELFLQMQWGSPLQEDGRDLVAIDQNKLQEVRNFFRALGDFIEAHDAAMGTLHQPSSASAVQASQAMTVSNPPLINEIFDRMQGMIQSSEDVDPSLRDEILASISGMRESYMHDPLLVYRAKLSQVYSTIEALYYREAMPALLGLSLKFLLSTWPYRDLLHSVNRPEKVIMPQFISVHINWHEKQKVYAFGEDKIKIHYYPEDDDFSSLFPKQDDKMWAQKVMEAAYIAKLYHNTIHERRLKDDQRRNALALLWGIAEKEEIGLVYHMDLGNQQDPQNILKWIDSGIFNFQTVSPHQLDYLRQAFINAAVPMRLIAFLVLVNLFNHNASSSQSAKFILSSVYQNFGSHDRQRMREAILRWVMREGPVPLLNETLTLPSEAVAIQMVEFCQTLHATAPGIGPFNRLIDDAMISQGGFRSALQRRTKWALGLAVAGAIAVEGPIQYINLTQPLAEINFVTAIHPNEIFRKEVDDFFSHKGWEKPDARERILLLYQFFQRASLDRYVDAMQKAAQLALDPDVQAVALDGFTFTNPEVVKGRLSPQTYNQILVENQRIAGIVRGIFGNNPPDNLGDITHAIQASVFPGWIYFSSLNPALEKVPYIAENSQALAKEEKLYSTLGALISQLSEMHVLFPYEVEDLIDLQNGGITPDNLFIVDDMKNRISAIPNISPDLKARASLLFNSFKHDFHEMIRMKEIRSASWIKSFKMDARNYWKKRAWWKYLVPKKIEYVLFAGAGHSDDVKKYIKGTKLGFGFEKDYSPSQAMITHERRSAKTVLVVDDEEGQRQKVKTALTDLGYTIVTLEDGDEVIPYLDAGNHVDLIISDWNMKRKKGFELKIDLQHSAYSDIPFLLRTSNFDTYRWMSPEMKRDFDNNRAPLTGMQGNEFGKSDTELTRLSKRVDALLFPADSAMQASPEFLEFLSAFRQFFDSKELVLREIAKDLLTGKSLEPGMFFSGKVWLSPEKFKDIRDRLKRSHKLSMDEEKSLMSLYFKAYLTHKKLQLPANERVRRLLYAMIYFNKIDLQDFADKNFISLPRLKEYLAGKAEIPDEVWTRIEKNLNIGEGFFPDLAMKASHGPGGIDLNTQNASWSIRKEGPGVEVNLSQAMDARIEKEGIDSLIPEIISITPVASIWSLIQ